MSALVKTMFIQIRRLSLIKKVPNYGKQKKYKGISIPYGDLMKDKEVTEDKETHTVEPIYSPIEDYSRKGRKRKREEYLSNTIKDLETVEEKIFKINMPRYYGWKSLILNEHVVPYNGLTHAQHITKTHIVKELGLPAYYNSVISNEQLDNLIQEIKSSIEDTIVFEHCKRFVCVFY